MFTDRRRRISSCNGAPPLLAMMSKSMQWIRADGNADTQVSGNVEIVASRNAKTILLVHISGYVGHDAQHSDAD